VAAPGLGSLVAGTPVPVAGVGAGADPVVGVLCFLLGGADPVDGALGFLLADADPVAGALGFLADLAAVPSPLTGGSCDPGVVAAGVGLGVAVGGGIAAAGSGAAGGVAWGAVGAGAAGSGMSAVPVATSTVVDALDAPVSSLRVAPWAGVIAAHPHVNIIRTPPRVPRRTLNLDAGPLAGNATLSLACEANVLAARVRTPSGVFPKTLRYPVMRTLTFE
jgi:hypothetical protein